MMKKYLAFLLIVTLFSCKDEETPLFRMEYFLDVPFQPSTNTAITFRVSDRSVNSTFQKMLDENNLTADDVKTVRVRSAVIFPVNRSIDYGLLQRIDVSIFETDDPDDLLVIAEEFPPLSVRGSELAMLPGLPNVKRFVSQDFFGLDVGYVLRRPLAERIDNVVRLELEAVGF